jgi:hypothetical protein
MVFIYSSFPVILDTPVVVAVVVHVVVDRVKATRNASQWGLLYECIFDTRVLLVICSLYNKNSRYVHFRWSREYTWAIGLLLNTWWDTWLGVQLAVEWHGRIAVIRVVCEGRSRGILSQWAYSSLALEAEKTLRVGNLGSPFSTPLTWRENLNHLNANFCSRIEDIEHWCLKLNLALKKFVGLYTWEEVTQCTDSNVCHRGCSLPAIVIPLFDAFLGYCNQFCLPEWFVNEMAVFSIVMGNVKVSSIPNR